MNVANLGVNAARRQRFGGTVENIFKTLALARTVRFTYSYGFFEFLLLFVNDSESEVNFITFAIVGIDVQDVRKGLLGVVKGSISIVQQSDSVPDVRILRL
jgi:hypothetical protein